jgi:hypothetical protein
MSSFWKAFVATAAPLSAMGIAAFVRGSPGYLVGATLVCDAVALAAAVVMAVRRRRRVAAGIFTGLAASALVLVVSCFASIFTGHA